MSVDLTNCDDEPIHAPGSIQPHGMLAAVEPGDLHVVEISANCMQYLGVEPGRVLGRTILEHLAEGASELIMSAQPHADLRRLSPFRATVTGGRCDATVSRSEGLLHLELEPRTDSTEAGIRHFHADVRQAALRLQSHGGVESAWQAAAEEVRRITGFDRVMVYRFHEDDHGEVVAEARASRLSSYLGLHYPASDIPAQARRMYRENWLRLIPKVDYEPVPLIREAPRADAPPLDLSQALLRSVSPIHLEYLTNMGVAASMSVSLVSQGRLWGLIACHHYAPRHVRADVRTSCEFLGQTLSWMIAAADRSQSVAAEAATAAVLSRLAASVAGADDLLAGIAAEPEDLLELVGASGAIVWTGTRSTSAGTVPPPDVRAALGAWLSANPRADAVAWDRMPDGAPALGDAAAGLLAIDFPREAGHHVAWFRPEQVRTVSWGGDPAQSTKTGPLGTRLTPRGSFELWNETVRGRSKPWTAADLAAARGLRRILVDAVARRSMGTGRGIDVDAGSRLLRMVRGAESEFLTRREDVDLAAVAREAAGPSADVEVTGSALVRADERAFGAALRDLAGALRTDGAHPKFSVRRRPEGVELRVEDSRADAATRWSASVPVQLCLRWFSVIVASHDGEASVSSDEALGVALRVLVPDAT